jgi:hypothetical protein
VNARPGEIAAVFAVALGANIGRQSFDSVLQRDAPEAARGRAFARFETVFQLVWVVGALIAVVFQPSLGVGLIALAAGFGLTGVLYVARLMATTPEVPPRPPESGRPATDARDR